MQMSRVSKVMALLVLGPMVGCQSPVILPGGTSLSNTGAKYQAHSLHAVDNRFSPNQLLVRMMPGQAPPVAGVTVKAIAGGYQLHQLPPGMAMDQAMATYERSASVLNLEQVELVPADPVAPTPPQPQPPAIPVMTQAANDTLYSQQWAHMVAHVPDAWKVTKGRSDVIVAVLDSGVDASHPDLVGQVLPSPVLEPGDDYQGDVATSGHGTHCAGIIAAKANNGVGVAGIAPECRVLPLRIYGITRENGKPTGPKADPMRLALALQYAATQGHAKVITISQGLNGLLDSQAVRNMVDYARGQGLIICVSSGNNGSNTYTGDVKYADGVLAVNATDAQDRIASFSNYGNVLGISAPGVSIMSTVPVAPNLFTGTSNGKNGYSYMSGTSMASPFMAGVAALVVSAMVDQGNKDLAKSGNTRRLAPSDIPGRLVEDLLRASCIDLGQPRNDEVFGVGRIDAARAVKNAVSPEWLTRLVTEVGRNGQR